MSRTKKRCRDGVICAVFLCPVSTPSFCGFWHCHPYIPIHFWKMFYLLCIASVHYYHLIEEVLKQGSCRSYSVIWLLLRPLVPLQPPWAFFRQQKLLNLFRSNCRIGVKGSNCSADFFSVLHLAIFHILHPITYNVKWILI